MDNFELCRASYGCKYNNFADWPDGAASYKCACGESHDQAHRAVHWRGKHWRLECAFKTALDDLRKAQITRKAGIEREADLDWKLNQSYHHHDKYHSHCSAEPPHFDDEGRAIEYKEDEIVRAEPAAATSKEGEGKEG